MADELDLLRTADPAPADGPHFADGPLPRHAEQHLTHLLHTPGPLPTDGGPAADGGSAAHGESSAHGRAPTDGRGSAGGPLPGGGWAPTGGRVPAEGRVPTGGRVSEDGSLPGGGRGSAGGPLPGGGWAPTGGRVPAEGRVPTGGRVSEDGPLPGGGRRAVDGSLPGGGWVSVGGRVVAEGCVPGAGQGADPLPAGGRVAGDGPVAADVRDGGGDLLGRRHPDRSPHPDGSGLAGRSGAPSLDRRARWHPGRSLCRRRPGRPVRVVWGLAATVVVVAVVLSVLLGGSGTVPAVAAPRPLAVRAHSTAVPLAQVAELARVAAGDGSPGLRQGTHVQSWSLGMSDDGPPITLPEERVVRWRADGSHTEVVVATDPSHPGRPVVTDGGLAEDGKVLSRHTFPPMWGDAPPLATPPHDPAKLRTYLSELVNSSTLTTSELLDATRELLDNWTLGARETAALAALLADTEGLRPAGQVTDRLGRTGQAYVCEGAAGARRMLILDPGTGAVLGLETTFTRDDPEYGVRAGDVMEYSAWLR